MRWLLVVAAVGCATPKPWPQYQPEVDSALRTRDRGNYPSPDSVEPRPWKVSEWALYRRIVRGEVGFKRVSVVARDACGVWVRRVEETSYHKWSWTFCFRDEPTVPRTLDDALDRLRVAIFQNGDTAPIVTDFRTCGCDSDKQSFMHWVSSLFPTVTDPALPREDLAVVAGRFAQTTRWEFKQFGLTEWTDSYVPFDGLVQARLPHGESLELLAFGTCCGADDVVAPLATAQAEQIAQAHLAKPSRFFFGFGIAIGDLSGHDAEASSGTAGWLLALGARLTRTLDLELVGPVVNVNKYSPDPTQSEDVGLQLARLRWRPRDSERGGFYLAAEAGYAGLERDTGSRQTSSHDGGAVGGALGFRVPLLTGWGAGFELEDDIVMFGSGAGIRNYFAALTYVELIYPDLFSRMFQ